MGLFGNGKKSQPPRPHSEAASTGQQPSDQASTPAMNSDQGTAAERRALTRYQHEENMARLRKEEREANWARQDDRRKTQLAERKQRREARREQAQHVLARISAWRARRRTERAERSKRVARGGMRHAVHRFGHRYLKLLFVTALAASTSLFFIGRAVPNPPGIVIVLIGTLLGGAIELSYYTVSCDLTDAITDGHKGSAVLNFFYTLIGAGASWFFFTNAALHVGWAPADDLIGLSRTTWAMIAGALVVGIVFVLSARREKPESATDLQAMASFVMANTPDYTEDERLLVLAGMANALRAARQGHPIAVSEPAVEARPTLHSAPQQEQPSQRARIAEESGRGEDQPTSIVAGRTRGAEDAIPLPGVRPSTNHHNGGEMSGTYERWTPGSEDDKNGTSFRG